jgi:glutamate synthase (NADPH/NADH) large chain
MTGGIAVILGETGRNFAAGMSGGIAFIWDPAKNFPSRCNMEMVNFDPLEQEDIDLLRNMIKNHYKYTGSDVAETILKNFDAEVKNFVKVMPTDYKAVLLKRKNKGTTDKEVLIHG